MKYLKYFPTEAEYNAFIQSEDFILPNVSYIENEGINYNPNISKLKTLEIKGSEIVLDNTQIIEYIPENYYMKEALISWIIKPKDSNIKFTNINGICMSMRQPDNQVTNINVSLSSVSESGTFEVDYINNQIIVLPSYINDLNSLLGAGGALFLCFQILDENTYITPIDTIWEYELA